MLFADIDEIIDRTPEEKPMPDNEIIEALECCSNPNNTCEKCPLYVASDDGCECAFKLRINALDLINRLKAEIEELQRKILSCNAEMASCKAEAAEDFARRLKAFYTEDNRYNRPNAHTLIEKLFYNIDTVKKELAGDN